VFHPLRATYKKELPTIDVEGFLVILKFDSREKLKKFQLAAGK
jgi:hypothetical protein